MQQKTRQTDVFFVVLERNNWYELELLHKIRWFLQKNIDDTLYY